RDIVLQVRPKRDACSYRPVEGSGGNSKASTLPDAGPVPRRVSAIRSGTRRDWRRLIRTYGSGSCGDPPFRRRSRFYRTDYSFDAKCISSEPARRGSNPAARPLGGGTASAESNVSSNKGWLR